MPVCGCIFVRSRMKSLWLDSTITDCPKRASEWGTYMGYTTPWTSWLQWGMETCSPPLASRGSAPCSSFFRVTPCLLSLLAWWPVSRSKTTRKTPSTGFLTPQKGTKTFYNPIISMKSVKHNEEIQRKVEKFYAYKWSTEKKLASMDFNELKPFLPENLVVEIMSTYFK